VLVAAALHDWLGPSELGVLDSLMIGCVAVFGVWLSWWIIDVLLGSD